jgi:hypothetical protein
MWHNQLLSVREITLTLCPFIAIVVLALLINTFDCFMPLSNVKMHCLLLSWLVLIVLFHCRVLLKMP